MKQNQEMTIRLQNVKKEYQVFDSPKQRLFYTLTKANKYKPGIFTATKDISFEINRGEILGLVGRNGAGKSTILKMITGVSYPTSGSIEVNGRISSLLELGAGFNPELTGIENIYFQGDLLGISKEEMEQKIPDILAFAEIGDFVNQPVKNYSSGMFARLAFATAIHVDPDVLLVDEVLAVGDIAFQFKCIEKMKEFAKQGVTIIFVTHSMMQLYRFCSRAIWLDGGVVRMDGEVEDVVPRYEDHIKMQEQEEAGEKVTDFISVIDTSLMQNGKKVHRIERQKEFSFRIKYQLNQELAEEPYFATSITKEGANYDIFGIFPQQERYTLSRFPGTYEIEMLFKAPQLNIGMYDLQFAILEKNGISHLYFGKALDFEVYGTQDTLGLLDMPHEIKINKIEE